MIFNREYVLIYSITDSDSSSRNSMFFSCVIKRHHFFRKWCDVNFAVLGEDKFFDLWMVDDNGKMNVVAVREEHLENMKFRRELFDGVERSKGWWILYFIVTEDNVLLVYRFPVWLFSFVYLGKGFPRS